MPTEFPNDWSYYWDGQVNDIYNPETTITGVVGYINLSLLSGLGDAALSDGADIRVSDTGNNQIACDLMPWYNNGSGLLIYNQDVKTTGITYVRVWAGNPDATFENVTGEFGQYNAYPGGAVCFHPSGIGYDRTRNQNHLISSGTFASGMGSQPFTGGKSTYYHGSGMAEWTSGLSSSLGTSATFVAWGKADDATPSPGFQGYANLGPRIAAGATFLPDTGGTASIGWFRASNNTTPNRVDSISITTMDTWRHVACTTRAGSNGWRFYLGGGVESQVNGISPVYYDDDLWSLGLSRDSTAGLYFYQGEFSIVKILAYNVLNDWVLYDLRQLEENDFWVGWDRVENSPPDNILYLTGLFPSNTHSNNVAKINFNLSSTHGANTVLLTQPVVNELLYSLVTSYTNTTHNPIINELLYNIVASYTNEVYGLNVSTLGVHELQTICGVLSNSDARIVLNFSCSVNSNNNTTVQPNPSILTDIRTIIESKTAQYGAFVSNLGLDVDDLSSTNLTASFTLSIPVGVLDSTISALIGTLTHNTPEPDNGNNVSLLVYLNRSDDHTLYITRNFEGDLYITRNFDGDLYITRTRSESLEA